MSIHPQVQEALTAMEQAGPMPHLVTPQQARQTFAKAKHKAVNPRITSEDRTIAAKGGDVQVRIYTPAGPGPFPVLVYFHGGGWVIGDLDTVDYSCGMLCEHASTIVVSVDYRLSPEHKYPAALMDAYDATRWVADNAASFNGDPERVAVGGESAGGNLAAAVSMLARKHRDIQIQFQLLLYPVTDSRFDTPSYIDNADGYYLTRDMMMWFWDHYTSSAADREDPLVAVLREPDLSALPPAGIFTAEHDPLRDEGEAYASRLADAGVATEYACFEGLAHGFMGMSASVDPALDAFRIVADYVRRAFATDSVEDADLVAR